ncbi:hypothetical protein ORG27_14755 [Stenotrophomonas lactitubi]|uniref:hypothetical protein n=1 Tax=Stenotrophomonas lactitubi TaxID=2045214 RepID=UPI00224968B4|nr:hypothetical protein [Stenotrophomonas lactitubi]MCX2894837.1 hypothetical protein [Stenotrophomonas lactitubi]
MNAETDWSAVSDAAHRDWVDGEREERNLLKIEELQGEIARLNEVVAVVSNYADQLAYSGKWANASDEEVEQNRIALELRRILGEIE